MRHMLLAVCLAILILSLARTDARAGTFDDGMRAYLEEDYARALACWGPLAENDSDREAQYGIAQLYERGEGVTADIRTALTWYRRAANQGHVHAQLALASLYEEGRGVPRNAGIALVWYTKAAEAGNPQAQYGLAQMIMRGEAEGQDTAAAEAWLARAAAQAYPRATNASPGATVAAVSETPHDPPPVPDPPTAPKSVEEVSVTAPPALPRAGFALRLGAYATRADAEVAWVAMREQFPRQLAELRPIIEAQTAGDADYFRLDAGPLANEQMAVDACSHLVAARQYCFPLRR